MTVSLLNFLNAIHLRPGMYTEVAATDYGAQLDRVEMLIAGYFQAVLVHGVRDPGVDLWSEFRPYLERRFGWNMSEGPIRTIRSESPSDEVA